MHERDCAGAANERNRNIVSPQTPLRVRGPKQARGLSRQIPMYGAGNGLPTRFSAVPQRSRQWVRGLTVLQAALVVPFPVTFTYALLKPDPPQAGTDRPAAFVGLLLLPLLIAVGLVGVALTSGVCVVCFRQTRLERALGEQVKATQVLIVIAATLGAALTWSWVLLAYAGIGSSVGLSMYLASRPSQRSVAS